MTDHLDKMTRSADHLKRLYDSVSKALEIQTAALTNAGQRLQDLGEIEAANEVAVALRSSIEILRSVKSPSDPVLRPDAGGRVGATQSLKGSEGESKS